MGLAPVHLNVTAAADLGKPVMAGIRAIYQTLT
jgi:hypothetical protein